jgi:hypothetical protein
MYLNVLIATMTLCLPRFVIISYSQHISLSMPSFTTTTTTTTITTFYTSFIVFAADSIN